METETSRRYRQFLISNYSPPPLMLVRGEGSYLWDETGRKYLDFTSGIAVNSLGHAHPVWTRRVTEQATTLAHCSNLYANNRQIELAERLSAHTQGGRWFFCNSGTEANEALIKLARLHGVRKTGSEGVCYGVITLENSFHGRTFGGLSATPQKKVQNGFAPLLPGFKTARINDIASFEAAMTPDVAAVLIEAIQGESGVNIASDAFLRDLRKLCSERGVMLMLDEVQCGTGRTGTFFAYEGAGIVPDAIGMAKGLGGGFPIGAIWAAPGYDDLFTPGSHGTTFGGNPLACAAALAVLEVMDDDNLLPRITREGHRFMEKLRSVVTRFPNAVKEVRGRGYMVGLAMQGDCLPWVAHLREHGLLAAPAGGGVIRLLPPLTVSPGELDEACHRIEQTLQAHAT